VTHMQRRLRSLHACALVPERVVGSGARDASLVLHTPVACERRLLGFQGDLKRASGRFTLLVVCWSLVFPVCMRRAFHERLRRSRVLSLVVLVLFAASALSLRLRFKRLSPAGWKAEIHDLQKCPEGGLCRLRIYAIAVKNRRNTIERALQRIRANYTIIDAVLTDSELVSWYHWHIVPSEQVHLHEQGAGGYVAGPWQTVVACFLSHIKALKTLIDDPDAEAAMIVEDDVVFLRDVELLWQRISDAFKLLNDADVVRLSYLDHAKHISPRTQAEFQLNGTWSGTQAYMISKQFAKLAVDTVDHPVRFLRNRFLSITSELVLNADFADTKVTVPVHPRCRVFVLQPPIAIERVDVKSTIGNSPHWQEFAMYGFENYALDI
jgi:GR25 family glycosyltransferase involved in LPS biosynthesis